MPQRRFSTVFVQNRIRNFAHSMKIYRRPVSLLAIVLASVVTLLSPRDALSQQRYTPPVRTQYDSAQSIRDLRERLDNIFSSRAYANGKTSVSVWSITRNKSLYERNPSTNLTPASTTKLFSTAALYHLLGPSSVLTTDVRYDGTLGSDGTLRGNLYLIGHGDALLSVNDLEELADNVRAAGVRRIIGNVYGDGSAFEAQSNRAVYSGDYEEVAPVAPVVALNVNRGTIAVVASAGRSGIVSVQTIPESDAVNLTMSKSSVPRARSAPKKSNGSKAASKTRRAPSKKVSPRKRKSAKKKPRRRASLDIGDFRERFGDAPPEPRQRRRARGTRARVRATSALLPDGTQQISVVGSPGRNTTSTVYVQASRPAQFTAGVFTNRLRSGGIEIDGVIGERQAPASARFLTHVRRPMSEIVSVVNKRSDNYLAEHVFKAVGSTCGDHTATSSRARRTILEILDTLGVQRYGCVFNDGSGLSRRNLVSSSTQVQLLRKIHTLPWGREFRSTLAIASYDGTIRGRMHGTPAANNVTAKTGTLRNVSSLSGYVTTADGELLAFCFMSNGPAVGTYKQLENLAAATLASFRYGSNLQQQPQLDAIPVDTTSQEEGE